MGITLSRQQCAQLRIWAENAEPEECCGLLLGHAGNVEIIELTLNVAADRSHTFEIDPASLIAAEKAARLGGPSILGYFHSHPNGQCEPSSTDALFALDDGRIWLIIAGQHITAWRSVAHDDGPLSFVGVKIVVLG